MYLLQDSIHYSPILTQIAIKIEVNVARYKLNSEENFIAFDC